MVTAEVMIAQQYTKVDDIIKYEEQSKKQFKKISMDCRRFSDDNKAY